MQKTCDFHDGEQNNRQRSSNKTWPEETTLDQGIIGRMTC
jgi:hypothetical protein